MNAFLLFALALVPIVGLIIALGVFKVGAHKATPFCLLAAGLLSLKFWHFTPRQVGLAALDGGITAIWPIMLVIIAAIFTYKMALEKKAGSTQSAMDTIRRMLGGVSTDKRVQVLILAWGFGGFMEGVAGYGTAVAIPASIMLAVGFDAIDAAVICLLANTVPTAFGALGIPVSILATNTNLNPMALSLGVVYLLTPFIILMPFALVMLTGRDIPGQKATAKGFTALKGVFGITLVSGLAFSLPQIWAAKTMGPELPAVLGSLASMLCTIGYAKLFMKTPAVALKADEKPITFGMGFMAWLPYLLILIIVVGASKLFPHINASLSHIKTVLPVYPGKTVKLMWIATPGSLILIAAVIGSILQGFSPVRILTIFGKTAWSLNKATLTVVCILAMAKIMEYSGMTASLASVLAATTGSFFPLVSPFIGTMGTFVTGSDTSSNILFGGLQVSVAKNIHASPYWLAAANTAGATAGKMISPQSIVVATSALGLVGNEGKILGKTIQFCLVYTLTIGIAVWLLGSFALAHFPAM